jgi:hypothetical protein
MDRPKIPDHPPKQSFGLVFKPKQTSNLFPKTKIRSTSLRVAITTQVRHRIIMAGEQPVSVDREIYILSYIQALFSFRCS